jgi:hypothetical protein
MKTNCLHCGKEVVGRKGIKYCSANCKARAHVQKKEANKVEIVSQIDKILHQNRAILSELMGKHKQLTLPRINLATQNFDFNYITGIYQNSKGKYYYYVYDFAWMEFSSQDIMIVRK